MPSKIERRSSTLGRPRACAEVGTDLFQPPLRAYRLQPATPPPVRARVCNSAACRFQARATPPVPVPAPVQVVPNSGCSHRAGFRFAHSGCEHAAARPSGCFGATAARRLDPQPVASHAQRHRTERRSLRSFHRRITPVEPVAAPSTPPHGCNCACSGIVPSLPKPVAASPAPSTPPPMLGYHPVRCRGPSRPHRSSQVAELRQSALSDQPVIARAHSGRDAPGCPTVPAKRSSRPPSSPAYLKRDGHAFPENAAPLVAAAVPLASASQPVSFEETPVAGHRFRSRRFRRAPVEADVRAGFARTTPPLCEAVEAALHSWPP